MIVSFNEMLVNTDSTSRVATYIQGYIGYKTRSFQNVPCEPQAKNFHRKVMFRSRDIQVFVF